MTISFLLDADRARPHSEDMKNTTRRFETMVTHKNAARIPAIAWTGLAIRFEIDAKTAGPGFATKLRDRAEMCRSKANYARSRASRPGALVEAYRVARAR